MTSSRLRHPPGPLGGSPRRAPARDVLPQIPPWVLIAVGILGAALAGRLLATNHVKYGLAIILVAAYGPLVFFNLAAALAVWVAILFFQDLSVLAAGPNAVGVLVALGWIGAFLGGRGRITINRQPTRLLLVIVAFTLWITLTIAWAAKPGPAGTEAGYWWLAALGFLIVVTTIRTPEEVAVIAVAFVIGAVISVLIGLATGSLESSTSDISQTAVQGRFTGGGGDPNQQAAAFVAAMFLLIGLFSIYRRRAVRIWLVLAFLLMGVGFFATQSRGGLIALAVATTAALIVAPRQRGRILGLVLLVAVAGVVLVASNPGALTRITDVGGGTSGRSDLWRVAWQVFRAHPLVGIGTGNFEVVEAHYVLTPGSISRIQYLTDVPHLVHNTYLQLLAETGVVGLAGYLTVAGGSLWAGLRAATTFDRLGRRDYGDLARSVTMGTIGLLAALFFISAGDELRLWVLFALGPAMLGIAQRMARAQPEAASASPGAAGVTAPPRRA